MSSGVLFRSLFSNKNLIPCKMAQVQNAISLSNTIKYVSNEFLIAAIYKHDCTCAVVTTSRASSHYKYVFCQCR